MLQSKFISLFVVSNRFKCRKKSPREKKPKGQERRRCRDKSTRQVSNPLQLQDQKNAVLNYSRKRKKILVLKTSLKGEHGDNGLGTCRFTVASLRSPSSGCFGSEVRKKWLMNGETVRSWQKWQKVRNRITGALCGDQGTKGTTWTESARGLFQPVDVVTWALGPAAEPSPLRACIITLFIL